MMSDRSVSTRPVTSAGNSFCGGKRGSPDGFVSEGKLGDEPIAIGVTRVA